MKHQTQRTVNKTMQKLLVFNLFFFFSLREVDEAKVRKAYFRMAQKYHPDKNPEGRVRLELCMLCRTVQNIALFWGFSRIVKIALQILPLDSFVSFGNVLTYLGLYSFLTDC